MTIGTPITPVSRRTFSRAGVNRTPRGTPGGAKVSEEKIRVTVRVRPLSPKEQAAYDLVAWDFPDEHTIASKNLNHERPSGSYSFDFVFGPICSTRKVYEEGARDVALSALGGINATIFAYGQTSSGKTFTMRGITENAVKDIYEHIKKTAERDFLLKFSALEIYNETVVDLLNNESGSLRLLDDPEKGTIVEKIIEEIVEDDQHLRHLINICEAQRQVGETALNDKSSRSHQIIRVTIESSVRENSGHVKSLVATLNLVDLAGSERASQTSADGIRLKEGSHINRSLLTLTTVIRKLSCGRSGHVPYRDSKLTRILQPSLGGNARTAIICTMSPALSHVEQSRNTLSFATSAKEVTNSAQVNMVVSEKQLVKKLQKEVARLEAELRTPDTCDSPCLKSLLMEKEMKIQEKEMKIQKMEHEINEVKRQRDIAQSQLQLERSARKEMKGSDDLGPSHQLARRLFGSTENEKVFSGPISRKPRSAKLFGRNAAVRQSACSSDPSMLVNEIRKLEMRQRQIGEEATHALELLHKEFASHRIGTQGATETIAKLLSEIKGIHTVNSVPEQIQIKDKAGLKEEIARLKSQENDIRSLEVKLENVQRSIDKIVMHLPSGDDTHKSRTPSRMKNVLSDVNMPNLIRSPCSPMSSVCDIVDENKAPESNGCISGSDQRSEESNYLSPAKGTPDPKQSNSFSVKKMQRMFKKATEDHIRSIKAYVTELKERVAKLQYQKQLLVCQVLELEANDEAIEQADFIDQSPASWHLIFEDQRKQIIMLWHLCHVSLVHRTQFYLLFRGDPSDQIYMEVELRRLTWLEQHLAELGNASPALLGDDPASYVSSSVKALKQEREYLAKRVNLKLSADEREMLYTKWDIPQPDGGKQRRRLNIVNKLWSDPLSSENNVQHESRRVQLVNKLWSDPLSMENAKESAQIVAKLVGFWETEEPVSKEMFALNFVSPCDKKNWLSWNLISNLLHL